MSQERILRVYIHQGHSAIDSGVVAADGYKESEFTKAVGVLLAERLKRDGHVAFLSRERLPRSKSPVIAADANKCGVDAVVSIHANGDGPSAHGGEAFITGLSDTARRLADDFAFRFETAWPFRTWRGVKLDADSEVGRLAILRDTEAPAFLVEPGFLSNERESAWLRSVSGQLWIAEELYGAITDQLGR